jgi:branched-chain amino acid transport system substrate-binding protein
VLLFALASCGSEDPEPAPAPEDDETSASSEPTATDETETTPPEETFTEAACERGVTSADMLEVGTLLPLTGTLAYLGPPEIAGVGLAVSDINAAGGVADTEACVTSTDSGDSNDLTVSTKSAAELIEEKVSVVIGAASSSVTLNVVDRIAAAKIVEISPANTAVDLSGYSPFYFRTAPPDTVQGNALGQLVVGDGNVRVAFLVFNDTYGTGLRNFTQKAIEEAGGEVVYGAQGAGEEFPAGQTTFSSEVTAAISSNPDAIVVLAFDETKSIIPELKAQDWDMAATYYSDGNTADYSKEFEPGTLEGAQGTIPGADPSQEFKDRLVTWYDQVEGQELQDFAYSAESYDATVLAALAAHLGGATDPVTIQKNLPAVSGSTGGQECMTFEECKTMLDEGGDIRYVGPSSIGPFNEDNDPSSAFIGVYKFDADNKPIFANAIEGSTQ